MSTALTLDVRQARRQAQLDHLDTVLALPERAWAEALHGLWPDKLPKAVRARLPGAALAGWRRVRGARIERTLALEAEMLKHLAMHEATGEVLAQHMPQAQQIQRLVGSLTNLCAVTIVLGNGLARKLFPEDMEDQEDMLLNYCLALETDGQIVLRQTLALRTQVRNPQGQMEWRPQELVYGISCRDGQWEGLTAAQMKRAYEVDGDGNPMPPDPGTSFGDAKHLQRGLR